MFMTITKAQLLDALADLPEGARLAFSSDYGDYTHTEQLHRLKGDVEEVQVRESGYSDSGYAVRRERDGEDGEDAETVWVIS